MFITEMELLQARLAAGKRLNDSHILKEILQEDRSSERKRRMAEGERYYRGEHDSLQKDFRRSPISETKENGEEEMRMRILRQKASGRKSRNKMGTPALLWGSPSCFIYKGEIL